LLLGAFAGVLVLLLCLSHN